MYKKIQLTSNTNNTSLQQNYIIIKMFLRNLVNNMDLLRRFYLVKAEVLLIQKSIIRYYTENYLYLYL